MVARVPDASHGLMVQTEVPFEHLLDARYCAGCWWGKNRVWALLELAF